MGRIRDEMVDDEIGFTPVELTEAQVAAFDALLLSHVETEAMSENGWDVQKSWRAPFRPSEVPNGVILAYRRSKKDYLTATFNLSEHGDISFGQGHYDIESYVDALTDFHARCAGKA